MGRSEDPVVTVLKLCARCGEAVRAWLEDGREGMPGAEKVEHGMFEDHAPREEIEVDRDDRLIDAFIPLLKDPTVTESWQDAERAAKDGSSSPRVASTFPEEYRWSGLEEPGAW